MKTVKLTGRLGKEFGPEFSFSVSSPAEAIRALCYQIKGFEEELKKGQYRLTRIYDSGVEDVFDETALALSFGKAIGFKIEPIAMGSRKAGLGKLILGIVLVGAAFFTAGGTAGLASTAFSVGGTSITYANIAFAGGMLALQGASALLSPSQETAEETNSFLIGASGNYAAQGSAVPIVIGEAFVGSVVISQGISVEDTAITTAEADDSTEPPTSQNQQDLPDR